MYFATTVMTSLGQSISPTSEIESLFTIIVMTFGICNMAYVISTTGVLLSSVDANEEAFRNKRMRYIYYRHLVVHVYIYPHLC